MDLFSVFRGASFVCHFWFIGGICDAQAQPVIWTELLTWPVVVLLVTVLVGASMATYLAYLLVRFVLSIGGG